MKKEFAILICIMLVLTLVPTSLSGDKEFESFDGPGETILLYENFTTWMPSGWTEVVHSGDGHWEQTSSSSDGRRPYSGNAPWAIADSDGNPAQVFNVSLFSPKINLSLNTTYFECGISFYIYDTDECYIRVWSHDRTFVEQTILHSPLSMTGYNHIIEELTVSSYSALDGIQIEFYYTTNGDVYQYFLSVDNVKVFETPIVYFNGIGYNPRYCINDSVTPTLAFPADDFILDDDTNITGVHWWMYYQQSFADPTNFSIYFFADNGTGTGPTGSNPDPRPTAVAAYDVSISPVYEYPLNSYEAEIDPPFQATGSTKYWLSIVANNQSGTPPDYRIIGIYDQYTFSDAKYGSNGTGAPEVDFWSPTGGDVSFYLKGELQGEPEEPEPPTWENHKMHYPQLPDPFGWDVDFVFMYLGDDWICNGTGPVEDIHFWISWFGDNVELLPFIYASIWSNNATDPSHPEELLWEHMFTDVQFNITEEPIGDQGFYTPGEAYEEHNHLFYFRIDIENISNPFIQRNGTIYWLVIQMPYYGFPNLVGWKTTNDSWNDAAVWGGPDEWYNLSDPITHEPLDFAFVITGYAVEDVPEIPNPKMHYPQYPDPFGWDIDGYNMLLGDDWMCNETGYVEDIHFWVSWENDTESWENVTQFNVSIWTNDDTGNYSHPDSLIWNQTISDFNITPPLGGIDWLHYDNGVSEVGVPIGGASWMVHAIRLTPTELVGYNSNDITAVQFWHNTSFLSTHSGEVIVWANGTAVAPGSVLTTEPFTVNGEGWKTINLSNPVTIDASEEYWVGFNMTIDSDFDNPTDLDNQPAVDGKGDWLYQPLFGGWAELQSFGAEYDHNLFIRAEITQFGEGYEGLQGFYSPDIEYWETENHNYYYQIDIENISDPFLQYNGTMYWLVIELPFTWGEEWLLGWKTTTDGFMDEAVWGYHEEELVNKMHYPQLPDPFGWDVYSYSWMGIYDILLADDWLCTESGTVDEIHFWGSWDMDMIGTIFGFHVEIFSDMPEPGMYGYSQPNESLWYKYVDFGEYDYWLDFEELQGFYMPGYEYINPASHVGCFYYQIHFDTDQFYQEEGTIYWLSITADVLEGPPFYWGWKTTIEPFNDDACWTFGAGYPSLEWVELIDPISMESLDLAFEILGTSETLEWQNLSDPVTNESLDLSFVITGEPLDYPQWDINQDGTINYLDASILVAHYGESGYPGWIMSDINADGVINYLDASILISHYGESY